MEQPPEKKPHIVFLFSDTGGGHRSAAEAIIEALNLEFPNQFSHEMVDFFLKYAPPPLNWAGPTYPAMSRMEEAWGLMFKTSDDPDRIRVVFKMFWPYVRLGMYKLLREHPADVYVTVHPLINTPLLRGMKKMGIKTPLITVVTDLVTTHAAWFTDGADVIVIPSEKALPRAVRSQTDPLKMRIIGLPVADRFCRPTASKKKLREKLGWPQDLPIILLVGGGEGMGPLGKVANAINDRAFPAGLAVVCGKNRKLKNKLEKLDWKLPSYIYGYMKDMPSLMHAADIIITKAGPGTISEAMIAGLPIILYHRISGQEEGNVAFVTDEGAGVWAPETEQIIDTLREWIENPKARKKASEISHSLGRPYAAREIARVVAHYASEPPLK